MNARDSVTGRLIVGGGERLRAALASATITDWVVEVSNGGRQRLRAALASATVATWIRGAVETGSTAFGGSFLAHVFGWVGRVTRASWLYGWLTAEPEPDVVVIDLRETLIVGPILGLLDRVLSPAVRYWQHTESRTVLERLEAAIRAHPIRVFSLVVLAAVVTSLALSLALGSPSSSSVGLRLVVATLALAGTRVDASAADLAETRTYAVLVALLEPPEPPDTDDRERP